VTDISEVIGAGEGWSIQRSTINDNYRFDASTDGVALAVVKVGVVPMTRTRAMNAVWQLSFQPELRDAVSAMRAFIDQRWPA
jgi:hypothetical protein